MKNLYSFQHFSLILLLGIFTVSCETNDPEPPQNEDPVITEIGIPVGNVSSATIGSSGGNLNSADGNLSLNIPAGALTGDTKISIQPISNNAPLGIGMGYRLLPEGTTFSKPVKIVFHYQDADLKQTPEDFLWIVSQAGDGSWNAMLKSTVDKSANTVSVETAHFSDWSLGRFIDFSLDPVSTIVMKGQSISLQLRGFSKGDSKDDEELVPLRPIVKLTDDLTPLTPLATERLMGFKAKQWTLNGAAAPVSNTNGNLQPSGFAATYTAPGKIPSGNPVAVTVQLEASNKTGGNWSFMVTSNITVVESDFFVIINVDGKTVEYYQYGFSTATPPDPNNFSLVVCGVENNMLEIVASYTGSAVSKIFNLKLENPSEGTHHLIGLNNNGDDVLEYDPVPGVSYELDYYNRSVKNGVCDRVAVSGSATVTLTQFRGPNQIMEGSFSGRIYEDKPGYHDQCQTSDMHFIEGEFRLMRLK